MCVCVCVVVICFGWHWTLFETDWAHLWKLKQRRGALVPFKQWLNLLAWESVQSLLNSVLHTLYLSSSSCLTLSFCLFPLLSITAPLFSVVLCLVSSNTGILSHSYLLSFFSVCFSVSPFFSDELKLDVNGQLSGSCTWPGSENWTYCHATCCLRRNQERKSHYGAVLWHWHPSWVIR